MTTMINAENRKQAERTINEWSGEWRDCPARTALIDAVTAALDEVQSKQAITQYRIIAAPAYYTVADSVRQAIEEGWQPFGGIGIAIASSDTGEITFFHFAQAMVKTNEPIK